MPEIFDAIVLTSTSRVKVGGLSCAERGRRVALKAGAARVLVADETSAPGAIEAFAAEHPERALVVIDAIEHVVHVPLVAAVKGDGARIAVDEQGGFAGCVQADAVTRTQLAAAAARGRGPGLEELATRWRQTGVETKVHGDIARHPARTAEERSRATYFLFGLVRKAQDTWLVRTINRKVSYPFARLLLPTPITPNMISCGVFVIGLIGCVVLTHPGYWPMVWGTLLLLFAGYIDGCDGEVARIRLESSPLGAWIDTMADEATTVVFAACLGIHVYNTYGYAWIAWTAVLACTTAILSVYCVYYYLLATGNSGNSQDYPTNGGLLDILRLFVRREMINLGSVTLAVAGLGTLLYAGVLIGGIVTASVLVPQHIRLRRARRAARSGAIATPSPT